MSTIDEAGSDADTAFHPVRSSRVSDAVVEQIRGAILEGRFHPGDRLPSERELAKQFEVSRVTIRDALRTLEATGLLRIKPGARGGPVVSTGEIEILANAIQNHLRLIGADFVELIEVRASLAITSACLACEHATEEDLKAIRDAIEIESEPGQNNSVGFARAVAGAAHNRALFAMASAIFPLMDGERAQINARHPTADATFTEDYRAIYEAIVARDRDAASAAFRTYFDHITQSARTINV